MKKVILLLLSVFLFIASTLNIKVEANSTNYEITSSIALTSSGELIKDSYGVFTHEHGDYNIRLNDKYNYLATGEYPLYYHTEDNYYEVLKESIPEDMYMNSEDLTTLYSVAVIGSKWSYLKYKQAIDINGEVLPEGIGKFTKSKSTYTDINGNKQYIFEFSVYVRDGYILDKIETYDVDSILLPKEIINTFGTNNLIAIKNRSWCLSEDIKVYSKTIESEVYVKFVDTALSLPGSDYVTPKWPMFYLNFDIPIEAISQIEISFTGIKRTDWFFGLFKSEKETDYNFNIKSNQSVVLNVGSIFKKNTYDCISKDKYTFDDTSIIYDFRITPPVESFIQKHDLGAVDYVKNNSVGIVKMTYEYCGCTYVYVDGELGELKVIKVEGPDIDTVHNFKDPTLLEKMGKFFKDIFTWLLVILISFVVIYLVVYFIKKKDKRRNE